MIATLLLGVVVFVSTDVDDLFLLIVLFSSRRLSVGQIVVGQYLGIAALFLASLALSAAALVAPPAFVGWLGLLPILIGVKELVETWRGDDDEPQPVRAAGTMAVAAITIANGGDNIGVYTPLLATSGPYEKAAMAVVFALLTGFWLVAARWLAFHPRFGAPVGRYGHKAAPYVLIGLGVVILYRAGSLAALGL